MYKRYVFFLCLFAASCSSALFAGSSELTGIWQFTIDKNLDGRLVPLKSYQIKFNAHSNKMMGHYVGIDNDSNWELTLYAARGNVLVSGIQWDADYYKVVNGVLSDSSIRGTWFDVGGQSGEFELKKIE